MSCEGCVGAVKRVLGKMEGNQLYLRVLWFSRFNFNNLLCKFAVIKKDCLCHNSLLQIEYITCSVSFDMSYFLFHPVPTMILFCIYLLFDFELYS